MKKLLLTLAATALVAGAYAANPSWQGAHRQATPAKERIQLQQLTMPNSKPQRGHNQFRAAADGTLTMNWTLCNGLRTGIPMMPGEIKEAIRLNKERATAWAGATISAISVPNPADMTTKRVSPDGTRYIFDNPVSDCEVWISEDLDAEPIVKVQAQLGKYGAEQTTIQLPEVYTIKADTPIYIGYTFTVPTKNVDNILSIITDGAYPSDPDGCFVYSKYKGITSDGYIDFGDEYKWSNIDAQIGNIGISAQITGDMLPTNDVSNYMWLLPMYTVPNEPFSAGVMVQNMAANEVSSLEFTMEIDGMEPQKATVDLEQPIGYFDISEDFYMNFTCSTVGNNIGYKLYISAINGTPVDLSEDAISGVLLCIKEGYPRNVVIEEATGTWCGWCVVGYVGMERMAEKYSDKGFIGIAIHGGDEMDVLNSPTTAYNPLVGYINGFPSAYANRDMTNDIYPSPEDLEESFMSLVEIPAYATISANLAQGDSNKQLKLSTNVKFGGSEENARYAIGYSVIEDGVGPYMQSNYTSGSGYDYYGFEKLPKYVSLTFNDVARNCSKPMGITGSIPASIEKEKEYTHEEIITLKDVVNPNKVRVAAYVINLNNGAIENACMLMSPAYSGVQKVVSSSEESAFAYGDKGEIRFRINGAKAQVFSIDGRCVASGVKGSSVEVPAGVYVITLNGKSLKVVVR